mmetsp:Transcript_2538/g.5401  ORF Transcript_2538/g.5401 Transcript_2538/m.5401 type:complete len:329 (-) Transcript_2538:1-987(-)
MNHTVRICFVPHWKQDESTGVIHRSMLVAKTSPFDKGAAPFNAASFGSCSVAFAKSALLNLIVASQVFANVGAEPDAAVPFAKSKLERPGIASGVGARASVLCAVLAAHPALSRGGRASLADADRVRRAVPLAQPRPRREARAPLPVADPPPRAVPDAHAALLGEVRAPGGGTRFPRSLLSRRGVVVADGVVVLSRPRPFLAGSRRRDGGEGADRRGRIQRGTRAICVGASVGGCFSLGLRRCTSVGVGVLKEVVAMAMIVFDFSPNTVRIGAFFHNAAWVIVVVVIPWINIIVFVLSTTSVASDGSTWVVVFVMITMPIITSCDFKD